MPHLVILYTGNLESQANFDGLCRALADTMLAARDEQGQAVFPPGGIRVLAYPAPHFAVADGGAAARRAGKSGELGFVYLNLRMGKGRSALTQTAIGQALIAVTKQFFDPLLNNNPLALGVTLQIDVGQEVFDGKASSIHPLFQLP